MEYFNKLLSKDNVFSTGLPEVKMNIEREPTIAREDVVCTLQKMARDKATDSVA